MPQYRKDRKARWMFQVADETGRIRTQSFDRKSDGEDWVYHMRQRRQRIRAGLEPKLSPVLAKDFIDRWIADRKRTNPESTWSGEVQKLDTVWRPFFLLEHLHAIKTSEIKRRLQLLMSEGAPGAGRGKKPKPISAATRNRHRALLHAIFQQALTADPPFISVNPVTAIPMLCEKKKTRQMGYWRTQEECDKYISEAYAMGRQWGVLSVIELDGGPRIDEALVLKWGDVDEDFGFIRICRTWDIKTGEIVNRTKGQGEGGSYQIPLFPRLRDALKEWRSKTLFNRPTDFIVTNTRGEHYTYWEFATVHEKLIERAGIPRITPHGLRHTCARNAQRAGLHKKDISQMLGHESEKTTDIYTSVDLNEVVERARVLGYGTRQLPAPAQ